MVHIHFYTSLFRCVWLIVNICFVAVVVFVFVLFLFCLFFVIVVVSVFCWGFWCGFFSVWFCLRHDIVSVILSVVFSGDICVESKLSLSLLSELEVFSFCSVSFYPGHLHSVGLSRNLKALVTHCRCGWLATCYCFLPNSCGKL